MFGITPYFLSNMESLCYAVLNTSFINTICCQDLPSVANKLDKESKPDCFFLTNVDHLTGSFGKFQRKILTFLTIRHPCLFLFQLNSYFTFTPYNKLHCSAYHIYPTLNVKASVSGIILF
jgi:hypothetical protein